MGVTMPFRSPARVACTCFAFAVVTGVVAVSGSAVTTATAAPATADAATISPIPAGSGTAAAPFGKHTADLTAAGYSETEHLAAGIAHVYSGPATKPATATSETVPYTTRVIVRAPSSATGFSGRVVVEPLNTSGGGDTDAAWGFVGDQLMDNGDAWVGVTVRYSSDAVVKQVDPVRYAAISIPTSSIAWDALAQVGQAVRGGGTKPLLGALKPQHVYMAGYSQSAIDVATYANAINADAIRANGKPVYDGFLVMARAASLTPVDPGTATLPAFEFEPMGKATSPVVDVES
jgi:hypothetical protein